MAWNKNVNTNAPSKSFIANLLKAGVAISGCAILFACGDDVTNENITQIVQENVVVVADVSKLPDCTSENEGQQALVKGEPSPRICVDGKWFATFSDYTDKLDDFKCSAEKLKDGSGLKILCNGDSIGVVLNGANGSNGVNGTQGVQGEKGDKGDTGAQGIQGEKGDKGDTGAQGIQGEKGDKGDTGAQGIQGEKGDKGDTGEQGIQGEKGDKGDTGAQGIQGEKGDKGDTGAQGIQGEKGDKGDTGEQGIQGEKGAEGEGCTLKQIDATTLRIVCGKDSATFLVNEVLNPNSSSSSQKLTSSSSSVLIKVGTLLDNRDQKTYKTVVVGSQTWMAENLDYADSTNYPDMKGRNWCYKNSLDSCAKYGRLYTWATVMDSAGTFSTNGENCGYDRTCSPTYPVRGICPEGWHLPTKAEFDILFTAVGGKTIAGKMLKSQTGWNQNGNGMNSFDFSALPAGERYTVNPFFLGNGIGTRIWSASEFGKKQVYFMSLRYDDENANLYYGDKYNGYPARCVKDE